MDFSQALELLKEGKKVCREGWNGKNMFIFHGLPKVEINGLVSNGCKICTSSIDAATLFNCVYSSTGVICMKTAQNTIVVGWLASQTDLLSDDWQIAE
jgi:hypothetical protein